MEDILIIGAGVGGIYAATLASLHQLKGVVLESLPQIGGQLTKLYPEKDIIDLPGYLSITAKDFVTKLYNQQQNTPSPLPIHLNESVLSYKKIDNGFEVVTNKDTYQTRTILLCTGMGVFQPRKTGIESEDQFHNIVYYLDHKEEFKDKEIAILGGGDSAVDWAIALSKIAKRVSIIHRREEFRAQASSVEQMEALHVNILKPYQVIDFIGKENVEKIVLENKNTQSRLSLPVDVIFVNYGMVVAPSPFNLEQKNNCYIVDTSMQTSELGVFAVGNTITYPGKVKNITSCFGEVVTAITKIDQYINPTKNIPNHY